MADLFSALAVAVVVFASTNIDDAFLLAAFFADPQSRPSTIVVGQFLGIGALVLVSTIAALLALALPKGCTAFLGVVPLVLGLQGLWLATRGTNASEYAVRTHRTSRARVLGVASVTIANGGDNLAVYVPLFASTPAAIPLYATVFALMTGMWCVAGHLLVNNRVIGEHVRRYGHVALPFVLVALGLWILSGARVLLR